MNLRKGIGGFLVVLEILIFIIVLVLGISTYLVKGGATTGNSTVSKETEHNNSIRVETEVTERKEDIVQPGETKEEEKENIKFSDAVTAKLAAMTVEEKVAQLFVISPEALTSNDVVTVAGKKTKTALEQYPVAGVVYTNKNFIGTSNTKKLLSGITEYGLQQNGLKLILAVEEQGDEQSPVAAGDKLPIQQALSTIYESKKVGKITEEVAIQQASASADAVSTYLVERGINLNIAPKVGDGEMLAIAKDMCNIASGKGLDTCVILQNQVEVEKKEQLTSPFLMMEEETNKKIEHLRQLGYEGIIMSPAELSPAAAVQAIQNGCGIVYKPSQFEETYSEILKAVNAGTISEEMLNQAVGRTLSHKMEGQ